MTIYQLSDDTDQFAPEYFFTPEEAMRGAVAIDAPVKALDPDAWSYTENTDSYEFYDTETKIVWSICGVGVQGQPPQVLQESFL